MDDGVARTAQRRDAGEDRMSGNLDQLWVYLRRRRCSG